jgi:hypothetical protein
MDLDRAIKVAYEDFALPVETLLLAASPARAFCRVVVRLHRSSVAPEIILHRLIDLGERGELPDVVVL